MPLNVVQVRGDDRNVAGDEPVPVPEQYPKRGPTDSQAFAAFSPAAFALAVSTHAAGIRAIFLIGTASVRLKREPFAAVCA